MEANYISLKTALEILNRVDAKGNTIPADITCRTYNRQSKKGGRLREFKGAVLMSLSAGDPSKARRETLESLQRLPKEARNPHHFENRTRNVLLPNKQIKKINLNYLISVNGQLVRY